MATPSRTSQRVLFGEFELDLSTRELWSNGTRQTLAPQPFQVLEILIENRGRLVSRDALVRHLWPSDTFVDYEQGLKKAVNRLRETLNDSAEQPRFIETLPRQGYRFIGNLEFGTAVRDRSADPVVVMPKRVPDESGAEIAHRKPISTIHLLWVAAFVILCVGGVLFWRSRLSHRVPPTVGEPKFTQLTANSFENPVTSSAISPDGKYLAFTDNAMRMHVRLLATGETRTIPQPDTLKGSSVEWSIAGWFPDSTRLIANARPPGSMTWLPSRLRLVPNSRSTGSPEPQVAAAASIWVVSILGAAAQKLRDDADAFSVSPDGSSIAFGTNLGHFGDREIWLMDARGQQARKLYEVPDDTAVGGLNWCPDGKRVIYFEASVSHGELVSRDLQGGPAIPLVRYSDWWKLTDFVPLPDGRLIYARDGNLWELGIDSRTGKPAEKPRQLTNWSGSWVGETSVTSDGRRLVFQRRTQQTMVSVADLQSKGTQISSVRRLTLNEYVNAAEAWTRDNKAIVFRTARNGHLRLFRQALDSDTEEPLVMGAENVAGSTISPDGSWLFYLDCGEQLAASCEGNVPVMAMPLQGGTPRLVLRSDTYGRPRCSFSPGSVCAVAEQSEDGKPLVFTAFDTQGRGAVLASFATEPAAVYSWSLSSDGTRIAILKHWDTRIHVVSLDGQAPQEIAINGSTRLAGVYWAADGKGFFAVSKNESGMTLWHVNLQGEPHPLITLNGDTIGYGMPSPDGRHLAIVATTNNNNVWMMENF